MKRAAIETGSKAIGYRRRCEHCGRGLEVVIVPVGGKTFTVPERVLDQLFRLTDNIEKMNVKMIQIGRIEGQASETEAAVPWERSAVSRENICEES